MRAERFDLLRDGPAPTAPTVTANLLRPLLLAVARAGFAGEPPRTLIASGLLRHEADEVAAAFAATACASAAAAKRRSGRRCCSSGRLDAVRALAALEALVALRRVVQRVLLDLLERAPGVSRHPRAKNHSAITPSPAYSQNVPCLVIACVSVRNVNEIRS